MEKNTSAGKIPLIQLKDIYKIYQMGDEEVRASDGISLTIEKGEFVAIVGKPAAENHADEHHRSPGRSHGG